MTQTVTMKEQRVWSSTRTIVKVGRIVYAFLGTMAQARKWGELLRTAQILAHGEDVVDVPDRAASLVWLDDVPHLFPGSVLAALRRGKGYGRGRDRHPRVAKRSVTREVAVWEKAHPGV